MITNIDLSRLQNAELLQFLYNILGLLRKYDPVALQVQRQYDALNNISLQVETIYKTPLGSVITPELEALDLRRDEILKALKQIITASTFHSDPTLKTSALLLEKHFSLYDGIADATYQSESASIRNILADWANKQPLADAVLALNLTSWKDELETVNNNFDARYVSRAEEMGNTPATSIKEKRGEINLAYQAVKNHLDAHYILQEGAEPYASIVNSINGLVDNYNATISRRAGGGSDDTADGATPAAPSA